MMSRRRPGGEGGATLVLVALMLVFMLAMVAIVIDGGQAYTDRRRMQNAADAAALAGARAVGQVRFSGATADLAAVVRAVATANHADAEDLFSCNVVSPQGAVVAACTPNSGWSGRSDASGVRVTAGVRRVPLFGALTGTRELAVSTTAAATLQPLLAARSPWMICGNALLPGGRDLVDPATRSLRAESVLRAMYGPGGSALADSRGIPIQGGLPGLCGLPATWVGAVSAASQPVRLGAFVAAGSGAPAGRYNHDDVLGESGCPTDFADGEVQTCDAAIPVFDEVDTATGSARVVAWAVWTMSYSSVAPVKWWGTFAGVGIARGGVTSDGPTAGRSTYVVRLTG